MEFWPEHHEKVHHFSSWYPPPKKTSLIVELTASRCHLNQAELFPIAVITSHREDSLFRQEWYGWTEREILDGRRQELRAFSLMIHRDSIIRPFILKIW